LPCGQGLQAVQRYFTLPCGQREKLSAHATQRYMLLSAPKRTADLVRLSFLRSLLPQPCPSTPLHVRGVTHSRRLVKHRSQTRSPF
jgi:hypothetical protein